MHLFTDTVQSFMLMQPDHFQRGWLLDSFMLFFFFFWKHWPSQLCNKNTHSQVFLINLDFSHFLLFSGTVTVFFLKSSSNCLKMRKKDFERNIIWNRLSDNCLFFLLCDKQAWLKQDSNISSFSVTDKCLNTSSTFW